MTRSASSGTTSESQMKFRTANSISSDQYFSDSQNGSSSGKSNLSRFEGSTSVSLADYFGRNESSAHGSGIRGQIQTPDLDDTDLKESVRQGITKVTGRISLLVNGVMSSIQEKYGL